MDAKSILDSLLSSGKQFTEQAKEFAESKLGLPSSGPERETMLRRLGQGALAGGAAVWLLGTKTGRKLTNRALMVGSLSALGAIAYSAYQDWAKQQGKPTNAETDIPIATLVGAAADQRSHLILIAMIAAAQADGVVDADEQLVMEQELERMDLADEAKARLRKEMNTLHDVTSIAQAVDSPVAAAEVYLVSSLVIDEANPVEKAYLEQLREALKIDSELVNQIRAQVKA